MPHQRESGAEISRHQIGARIAVIGLMLAAIAVRLPDLAERSLWLDEAWRANIALAPTWEAFWREVLHRDPDLTGLPLPPLYSLLLRAVALVVGPTEAGLRSVSLVASVATVPMAFALGRRLAGVGAGLAAAAAFALYPEVVTFGRELKQYATDVLVVLGLILAAARVADRPEGTGSWLGLAVVASLAPALAYPAALVLPGIAVGTLAVCRSRRALGCWVAAHGAAVLAAAGWYTAIIAAQYSRPEAVAFYGGGFPPASVGGTLTWLAATVPAVIEYACGSPAWLYTVLVLIGLALAPRWLAAAAVATMLTITAAAAAHLYPFAATRTSLFIVPWLYLPLGIAAGRLVGSVGPFPARLVAAMAMAAVVLLPARDALTSRLVVEQTRPLVHRLVSERRPDDQVYVYHATIPAFRFYHPVPDPQITLGGSHRENARGYERELQKLLVPGRRLWLLFSHVAPARDRTDERTTILSAVGVYTKPVEAWETVGASLHLLEVTRAPGDVRHLKLTPEDLRDPARVRELLRKPGG